MGLKFREVYIGKPRPVEPEALTPEKGACYAGAALSRGEVEGIARVVKSPEDAKRLREGEIMVAAFTDIGWSPYYCIIKGLITEVGSALSHGAVVAREYSLPVVANIANATAIIKTGDYVNLNGNNGTITIMETAESAAVVEESVV
jgi:pyruvate,water dikinase